MIDATLPPAPERDALRDQRNTGLLMLICMVAVVIRDMQAAQLGMLSRPEQAERMGEFLTMLTITYPSSQGLLEQAQAMAQDLGLNLHMAVVPDVPKGMEN